jgi:DNA-binding transcriptional LysR family regulator
MAPWEGTASDIYAIYPQRHHLSSKVRVFLDFLAAKFADQRALEASNAQVW